MCYDNSNISEESGWDNEGGKKQGNKEKLIDKGIEIIRRKESEFFDPQDHEECGMSPKGPYNYFEDANDFMNEIKHRILRGMMRRLYSDDVLREKEPLQRLIKLEKNTILIMGGISTF